MKENDLVNKANELVEQISALLKQKKDLEEELNDHKEAIKEMAQDIAELKKQKDALSRFNLVEMAKVKQTHKEEVKKIQTELDELRKQLDELINELKALTKPPVPVGKLIKVTENGTAIILDNHRAIWEVAISPKIKKGELEEGSEVEYTMDQGVPLAIFKVWKAAPGEIIVVKEIMDNGERALVTLPGDTLKVVDVAKKLMGTLEKGEEVFYDSVIQCITSKVPKEKEKVDLARVVRKTYEDVGGLAEQIRKIREVVELPLKHPELFEKIGILAPKGILLSGPPGCGKTLIGQAVANECGVFFIHISGPEIMNPYVGEPEARLRQIFDTARRYAPAIIFLDEIEAIAQKREEMHTGQMVEQRIVAQLLSLMDGLNSREQVIVIAATNVPDLLDPALRRPGRFDREIVIPVPDRNGRLEILKIHTKNMPLGGDVNLEDLADRTHGFTGADLEALCKEAAMLIFKNLDFDNLNLGKIGKVEVSAEYFEKTLADMKPSLMREVTFQKPTETWADVGGLEEVKQKLEEAIIWPLKFPELLKKAGHKPAKGILLYGPPGCGKTLVARALANECGVNFIPVKGPQLISKWVGESESNVRKLFKMARQSAPCIIFFDEIEALVTMRGMRTGDAGVSDKVTSQILTELDGIEDLKGVFILAATNRLELVDPALLRPGRFDELVYLPPPNVKAREKILEIHTRGKPLAEDVNLKALAQKSALPAGTKILISRTQALVLEEEMPFSGAVIASVCQRATQKALTEFVATHDPKKDYEDFKVCMKHFIEALKEIVPSIEAFAKDETSRKEGTKTSKGGPKITELPDEDSGEKGKGKDEEPEVKPEDLDKAV